MKRNAAFLLIFLLTPGLSVPDSYADIPETVQAQGEVLPMSLEDVSRLAIARNLGIRIFRKEEESFREEETIERSVYDSTLYADLEWERDESDNLSVFAPSDEKRMNLESGIRKEFPTGTTIDASVFGERQQSDSAFVSFNTAYEARGKIRITQHLLGNFFGIRERLRLEKVILDVRRFNFRTLENIEQSLFETREIFWRTVEDKKILAIQEDALREAQDFFKVTEEKLQLGLLEDPDHFAALANVREREIELLVASNRLKDRENELKTALEMPLEAPADLAWEEDLEEPELDREDWMKGAMERRYDRHQALLEIERQDLEVQITGAALWPTIDLEASFEANGLDDTLARASDETTDVASPTYFVGASFEFPLENNEAVGDHRQSQVEQAKALLDLKKVELEIAREVDQAYRRVRIDRDRVTKTDEVVELQRRKLEEEMRQFERGRSSSDRIIDFQRDLRSSRIRHAGAFSDYQVALDEFYKSSSRLLEPFEMSPAEENVS